MIVPAAIRRKHSNLQLELERLRNEVQATVQGFCDANDGFAYSGRLKTVESLAEKIETGRYEKWSELDDLFACCVIIPTLAHEEQVLEFLRRGFVEVTTKHRSATKKAPDVFRFEATRFIGTLRPTAAEQVSTPLYTTRFEVQARTAFEHACSVTTHAVYKGKGIEWRTRRLAALLKAAVEQLDLLVLTFGTTAETIEDREWPDLNAKQEIISRLEKLVTDGLIPEVLAPKDWSRFAENFFGMVESGYHGKRASFLAHVNNALTSLEREVKAVGHIPHSISLLQFSFGTLFTAEMLKGPLEGYFPLVTEELLELFPDLPGTDGAFVIEG